MKNLWILFSCAGSHRRFGMHKGLWKLIVGRAFSFELHCTTWRIAFKWRFAFLTKFWLKTTNHYHTPFFEKWITFYLISVKKKKTLHIGKTVLSMKLSPIWRIRLCVWRQDYVYSKNTMYLKVLTCDLFFFSFFNGMKKKEYFKPPAEISFTIGNMPKTCKIWHYDCDR